MKIERTRIHFFSDVFSAAPSSDLKVPNAGDKKQNIALPSGCKANPLFVISLPERIRLVCFALGARPVRPAKDKKF